jgi:hypothetical protein
MSAGVSADWGKSIKQYRLTGRDELVVPLHRVGPEGVGEAGELVEPETPSLDPGVEGGNGTPVKRRRDVVVALVAVCRTVAASFDNLGKSAM